MGFLFFLFLPLLCLGMEESRGHRSCPACSSSEFRPGPFILDPMWFIVNSEGEKVLVTDSALRLAKFFIPQMEDIKKRSKAFEESINYEVALPSELKDMTPIYVRTILFALYNGSFKPKEEEKEELSHLADVLEIEELRSYLR